MWTNISSGDSVSITPTLNSGTQIATYTINSTSGTLYAPTPTAVSASNTGTGATIGSITVGTTTTTLKSNVPAAAAADNGKVLTIVNGAWAAASAGSGLPSVTSADNGKFLRVVEGVWAAATVPDANGQSF